VEAKETVQQNPAVEERAKFALDEARDGAIVKARVSEPRLQVVLEHAVKSSRLGATWGIFGSHSGPAGVSHDAIVLPGSFQVQSDGRIGFPPSNLRRHPEQMRIQQLDLPRQG
jgi:hypothetical protein